MSTDVCIHFFDYPWDDLPLSFCIFTDFSNIRCNNAAMSCVNHMDILSRRGSSRKHVYDHPVNSILSKDLIEADPVSYIKQSKLICSYDMASEQERAYISISSCGIDPVLYFD